jgi:hypothetical protein
VIQLVSSIPLAMGLANQDLAQSAFAPAFAPSIMIDYTSLWGGAPQIMTPAALMAGWRGIVPGFDPSSTSCRMCAPPLPAPAPQPPPR